MLTVSVLAVLVILVLFVGVGVCDNRKKSQCPNLPVYQAFDQNFR